jgi:hypothetical protein
MPYSCPNPEAWKDKVIGNGQCVTFVKSATGAPPAALWRQGQAVAKNFTLARGTAIATFDAHGRYPNLPHGNHAAIYDSQDGTGIWVWEQFTGQRVRKKHYPFKGNICTFTGNPCWPLGDADAYSVVE